jgi:hypothetical protein
VTDFLDDRRKEITDRLKELKPVVDEFNRRCPGGHGGGHRRRHAGCSGA